MRVFGDMIQFFRDWWRDAVKVYKLKRRQAAIRKLLKQRHKYRS